MGSASEFQAQALCGCVCTHLYPLSQDLNEKVIGEHAAHQSRLTSDAGADTEPPLVGPHEERARGNLVRRGEKGQKSESSFMSQQLYI